jgi:MSHA biogenesis protein MshL
MSKLNKRLICRICIIGLTANLLCCARINGELVAEREMRQFSEEQASFIDDSRAAKNIPDIQKIADPSKSVKRFNIAVTNLPAKTFFLSLVSDAGVNVVVDPEISGTVSLELRNVTVEEVLKVAREVYGYEFSFDDGVYIIYSRKLRTEIFDVDYLNITREGSTETSVAIGAISESNSDSGGAGQTRTSNSGAGNTSSGKSASGTNILTTSTTDYWKNLEKTLIAIIGTSEGRAVIINPHASIIVVKALPKELSRVRRFLERAQINVTRQIILETKILEVTLSDNFEAGINWEMLGNQFSYTNNVTSFDSAANILGTTDNGELFSSVVVVNDIFRLLAFLETQGSVQVLSSPRVSTVNNQKAMIRVGTDEFFITGVKSNTTASAATTTTSPEVELTSFFSGISLDVTPQISADGAVVLHVHPLVSSVVDQQKAFTIGSDEFDLPLALRDIRESDSIVRAYSGEVVVLGGLMQETSVQNDGKRPLLGDIPIVNLFFKTKNDKKLKKELVILMRPVVVDDKTWKVDIDRSLERVEDIGRDFRLQR